MSGRPGGGGGRGGGAAAGQAPYAPGENDRLPWLALSVDDAIKQEEGTIRPILVLYYKSDMAKDCCAANFERIVFKDRSVVEFAKKFKCVRTTEMSEGKIKQYGLDTKKPAIFLFDAEGGLLHKVQVCQNPRTYFRAMTSAFKLNDTRMKLKKKYLALRKKARENMGSEKYGVALRSIESMLKKRDLLAGSVLSMIQSDRKEIVSIGQQWLSDADKKRGDEELLEAYEMYKKIKKEFARLDSLGKDAERCAKQVKAELKDLGLTVN